MNKKVLTEIDVLGKKRSYRDGILTIDNTQSEALLLLVITNPREFECLILSIKTIL